MEKVNSLTHLNLTTEQKEFASSVINRFGTGQHPMAYMDTIDGFDVDYLKSLLSGEKFKTCSVNLSDKGKETLKTLEEVLRKQVTPENDTFLFAEWINLNGIRNNEHEWKFKGDNWTGRYSTEEMYNFFKSKIKLCTTK
jgi:hypothetical protein